MPSNTWAPGAESARSRRHSPTEDPLSWLIDHPRLGCIPRATARTLSWWREPEAE